MDHDDDPVERRLTRYLPWLGAIVLMGGFGALVFAMVNSLSGLAPPPKPVIQQISIVQPPPPPPPPEMEPPPEPEMQEVEMPEPEPEPVAESESDEPPSGEDLGLDAAGTAGGDGFGLRARKGARGLIGGGNANRWYAGILQRDLQRLLSGIEDIRRGRYSVVLRVWIADDGTIANSEIVRGSGLAEVDDALARALAGGVRLSETPPADLPQPIKLQITSRT